MASREARKAAIKRASELVRRRATVSAEMQRLRESNERLADTLDHIDEILREAIERAIAASLRTTQDVTGGGKNG